MGNLYKILTLEEWEEFQTKGNFGGSIADKEDGFIHLAFDYQYPMILEKFFKNKNSVILAKIDPDLLGSENKVIIEANRPGGEKYPHLYGTLPAKALITHEVLDLKTPAKSTL